MTKLEFFKSYYQYALLCEKKSKVPALFTLAQAALESGWGKYAVGNNFFGIKASNSWTGGTQLITTTEYHPDNNKSKHPYPEIISITTILDDNGKISYKWKVRDYFRVYNSPLDSFLDHSNFLIANMRYKNAFNTSDPYTFAEYIANAGYATAKNYAEKIKNIISNLKTFL